MRLASLLAPAAILLAGAAHAQETTTPSPVCAPPSAPQAWSAGDPPAKPVPPKCLNLKNNTHTCSSRQFSGYNAQIAAYNEELKKRIDGFNAYNRELLTFQRGVSDFIRCEQDRLSAQMDALSD